MMDPVVNLKRPLPVDYSLCIFCQTHTASVIPSKASDHGLATVRHAASTRKKLRDSKNIDLVDHLQNVLDSAEAQTIVWHKMCYAHFTDKSKLERLQKTQAVDSKQEASCSSSGDRSSLRRPVEPVNWNLCIFCQSVVLKARLISVMTKQMSDQIIQASSLDYKIGLRLAGVIDLIAAEAKYHLKCLRAFTRSTIKTKQDSENTDLAMVWLCKELHHSADKGHVILLNDVWERYKELAEESSTIIQPSYYSRRSTFKEKLQSQLGDIFTFFQSLDRSTSERKTMLIPTKYQHTAVLQMKEIEETEEMLPQYVPQEDIFLSLVHVALKIRGDMMETPGHKGFSVSEDEAISCIPDSLYMLLRLIFGGQEALEDDSSENNEDLVQSRVLSIAQDLVYCISGGRKWTPKHIGLGNTLHQATRSKDLVELFNKAGHCLSYEQVLQVDTSLAESTLKSMDQATGAIIPPNIVANEFIHYTADNIDILDETLDGKNTFHATQMATWQRGQKADAELQMLEPSTRHTLIVPDVLENLYPVNINPATSEPVFTTPVDKAWFTKPEGDSDCVKQAQATDMAFFLRRQDSDTKPSWTVFNQSASSEEPEQTAVGYLPIILAPAHELDTLNTVVKRCMAISSHFGQEHTVLTVDQALFCKVMELKWSVDEYRDKLIPRLGGLHTAMNFLKAIGDHMAGAGLAEVWLESGLLGEGAVQLVLSGKAYNKAMRAHKLTLQALWRLLLPTFLLFAAESDKKCHDEVSAMAADDNPETIPELITCLKQERFHKLLKDFIESKSDDVNFVFWWNYMDMVSILLQFTRAQRDGIWDLHLHSFSLMLPYFMRYDHLNYARWGAVYIAEMHQLPEPVLSEFQRGNFVVKRSVQKFNQVDPDQAMEWINGTGKKGGGIIGITKTTSALCRWTLSYNLRSHIAAETHAMYNHCPGSTCVNNEATKSRQKRDNNDEMALLSAFQGFKVFASVSPGSLQNLATKDLATEAIQNSLLCAKELGQEGVNTFVEERMIVPEQGDKPDVPIHASLHRSNAKTFASLYEVVKDAKDKEKKTILKADRNILQRLVTAYEAGRQVDLPAVLKHELLPVPVSLAEMNGTLRTGNKSILADKLTEGIVCPEAIEHHKSSSCLIIDGQALVVALGKPNNAVTFGDLADIYVRAVLKAGSNYQRVDVVFDRYREETIKGATRIRRTKAARPIRRLVEGRDVPLPKNWTNFLSLPDNKVDLAHFLSEELCSQAPDDKDIIVAGGFREELEVRSSKTTTDLSQLRATHEEADTRLVLHAVHSRFNTVVVSSRDTDVLVLLVSHFPHVKCEHLWMMSGTTKKRRYIPINAVFNNLPRDSATTLLPFHALTGCDTTSYIANHTKRSAWKVFKEHHQLLINLGIGELTEETIRSSETFVCRIYDVHKTDSIDAARHILFSKTGKPEAMSPTSDALRFHLMRVHYQAMVWRNAHCAVPELPAPVDMGWKHDGDSGLQPILMSLSPIPESCLEMISCSCQKQCTTHRCKCRKSGLRCTAMCACQQQKEDQTPCLNMV